MLEKHRYNIFKTSCVYWAATHHLEHLISIANSKSPTLTTEIKKMPRVSCAVNGNDDQQYLGSKKSARRAGVP